MRKLDTFSHRHLNAASTGPAERVEEVRKPAELGPVGPTQTPRLSSLGRKRLCGSSSGFKKITLLLFHYKIPTLEGENIPAKLNIKLISKTWNFKLSAVMKWDVFFTRSSSISGRFDPIYI